MLSMKHTRIFLTEHQPVLSGHIIPEEGCALVWVKDGANTKVQLSTGAAGEIFAGVSLSRNAPAAFLPSYKAGMIPASGRIGLGLTPMAGQYHVLLDGVAATEAAAAPAAGEYQIDNNELVFNVADAAKAYTITFMFEPTVSQARAYTGDMPIGGLSSTVQEVIGMLTYAECSTSRFDASADWSGVINPYLGPNGTFAAAGPGTLLTNVIVESAPQAGNPFLTLRVKV